VLVDDLRPWKRANLFERRPQPLIIEVYIDTSHLAYNQALVIVDDADKRWDVGGALGSSSEFEQQHKSSNSSARTPDIVLERWTIELGNKDDYRAAELDDALPNVYKKGVVVFRSLFTVARYLPAWKLHKRLARNPGSSQAVKLKFRIRQGTSHVRDDRDTLYTPLCLSEETSGSAVGTHSTAPLLCSAGPLSISVDYRTNCDFEIDDAEALLSSRFRGLDNRAPAVQIGRSLPTAAQHDQARTYAGNSNNVVLPPRLPTGAYGSLGTFHGLDKRGSPVAELKQRMLDDETSYEEADRARQDRDAVLIRRPSISLVSNPPFKAGSLASSPRSAAGFSTSAGRSESYFSRMAGTSASKRLSLNTLPQQALRAPSLPNETAIASSGSASPKPAPMHRYSSSFAGRNKRFTSQSSKIGESTTSSGRGSDSSKEKSGQLNDPNAPPGSSGSGKERGGSGAGDDDDIASFISQIESVKDLPSFRSRPVARDNTVNLAKYSSRRDPGLQLAEEMSSSSLIQASSTPPSRRLSNVPGLSTSSSPSRVVAHMPHVRSRLSTHSIAEERSPLSSGAGIGGSGGAGSGGVPESPRLPDVDEPDEDDEEPFIFAQDSV
jgi:autophagy-related protein 13